LRMSCGCPLPSLGQRARRVPWRGVQTAASFSGRTEREDEAERDEDSLEEEYFGEGAFDAANFVPMGHDDLTEPLSVVLCGFRPEECAQFRVLLDEIGGAAYKVLPKNKSESMHQSVRAAVASIEVNWEKPMDSETISFPSSGSPRCLLFCGMPRSEVDIVTAILDENKTPSFAVVIVTEENVDETLGKVVVDALKDQREGIRTRKEFMSWKSELTEDDVLKKSIFKDESSKATFSSAMSSAARQKEKTTEVPAKERHPDADDAVTVEADAQGPTSEVAPRSGADIEKAEDEEEIAEGVFSKPLDLDGVRRDLAQDMKDDKVFMDPWHARGLEPDESRDVMKEEENEFIKRCQERLLEEALEAKQERAADLDQPRPSNEELADLSLSGEVSAGSGGDEGKSAAGAHTLTKEEIIELAKKYEDVDVDDILKRFSDRNNTM